MVEASPLHVMLTVMRRKWREGDEDGAVALAKAVAPYVHPKAAATRGPNNLAQVSDDELDEFIAQDRAATASGLTGEFD